MAVLTMPTAPDFRASRWGLRTNTQEFASPLDGSVQTNELAGSRWLATYTLPPMNRASAADWHAFLMRLAGRANRFHAFDPDARTARGVATGSPVVAGAAQTGRSLATSGWTASTTGIMKAGDYFHFNNGAGVRELHMVVVDANSDGGGLATLTIEPTIRSSPANGAALTVASASCEMALVDDNQAAWDADFASIYGISFSGIEVYT